MWDEVKALHKQGTTIFLTTHYLEEADELCDRVAIVDFGKIVALGSPAELKKQIAGDIVTLGFETESQLESASGLMQGNPLILGKHPLGDMLQVYVDKGDEALPIVFRLLGQGHISPKTAHLSRPTLDDVFLKLTGRSLRAAEVTDE